MGAFVPPSDADGASVDDGPRGSVEVGRLVDVPPGGVAVGAAVVLALSEGTVGPDGVPCVALLVGDTEMVGNVVLVGNPVLVGQGDKVGKRVRVGTGEIVGCQVTVGATVNGGSVGNKVSSVGGTGSLSLVG